MNIDTKRHIDSARQVLVGVVPNPTSQIDQITNALVYKFMDDMDQAAIKAGGEPSFFVGDLERYAWTRLMDSRMGNQERMNLYSEALMKFSEAKQLPELFRNIFKSAFLPYRSPETLGLFLKEIDFFDYSHPEELGNAYEYLLSIMSSQGDAGQFRTPRHIIDFIVDVVNPTKDDKVLDPACGTGGFLVSSYKHILAQHDRKDDPDKKEKPLTPDDRRVLMNNFEGYDIDPGMVRIAQVNMYLHQFKNPKIFQYDSLSSEERWGDKFDVILANPPFMSPKGGIKPHSKFSIQSSRSEVLFVDYIMNHLRPNGRAGIIVPDGIIFQSGAAHKLLRKNLIDDGLYAVVSLPSGVFQPYSGVKTSILFFDNEFAAKHAEILFVDIKNTGIGLTTTQRVIEANDIPSAIQTLKDFQNGQQIKTTKISFSVPRREIIEFDYDLMANKYRKKISLNPEAPLVALSEVCKITKGKSSSTKTVPGEYPLVLMAADFKTSDHIDFEGEGVCVPLMTAASTGVAAMKRVHYIKGKFALANLLAFVEPNDVVKLNPIYLYEVLLSAVDDLARLMKGAANVSMKTSDLESFMIPLPSIDVQNKIVGIFKDERELVESSKKQIEIYEQETKEIIAKLWNE
jgi:type I restriction enzyme M protein